MENEAHTDDLRKKKKKKSNKKNKNKTFAPEHEWKN